MYAKLKASKEAAALQHGAHAEMHSCMNTFLLLSGRAKEAQWSMCSLRQAGREGGSQGVPSSWVVFNQQHHLCHPK